MARIAEIETGFYRIPLPVTLSDSTHGEIKGVRADHLSASAMPRAQKVSATPTRSGAMAARSRISSARDPELVEGLEADDTEAIWHHVWWGLHYGGRGGPRCWRCRRSTSRCGI